MTHDELARERFEEVVYRKYQASRLNIGMLTTNQSPVMTKEQYTEKTSAGSYKNDACLLMWVGWKLFATEMERDMNEKEDE